MVNKIYKRTWSILDPETYHSPYPIRVTTSVCYRPSFMKIVKKKNNCTCLQYIVLLLFVADVELVRKMWKGLLDTGNQYRQWGKLTKTGSGYLKHKQCSLAAAMSWLDKYTEPQRYSFVWWPVGDTYVKSIYYQWPEIINTFRIDGPMGHRTYFIC